MGAKGSHVGDNTFTEWPAINGIDVTVRKLAQIVCMEEEGKFGSTVAYSGALKTWRDFSAQSHVKRVCQMAVHT